MKQTSQAGRLHLLVARVFRTGAEWLISRGLASESLRWRVRRFEQRGLGAAIGIPRIDYPRAFIAINVALMVLIFVYTWFLAARPDLGSGRARSYALLRLGAAHTWFIFAGEYWRLLTAVFLHADLIHILFNCIAIWIIGPRIEALYGPRRFLSLYLLAGVTGNAISVLVHAFYLHTSILLVGASGAIFGMLGAGAIYGLRTGGTRGEELFRFMMIWIVIGILYSFLYRGDNLAHAGGAIAGGLFAQVVNPRASVTYHRRLWIGIEIGCLVLVAACFSLAAYSFFAHPISY